jgi:Fic family protein|tara:strand:- start:16 stop:1116 length:1101 start_codon:yes stop_codon:yes gene_type:complete
MTWNWQCKDWPSFIYDASELEPFEHSFIHKAGIMHGSMKHISEDDKEALTINLMSDEALKTSEIEGELLNRDSLQSSIRKHFGLKTDNRRVSPAEQGISEMMVDLYKNAASELSHAQLFRWHEMLTNGRRDLKNIGAYRSHSEPMQIVSGDFLDPTVHYEAPPSEAVQKEMDQFVRWFNSTVHGGPQETPALARAGIAHIHFESVHPFEDGNGRIGRAISEKALSQSLGRPTLIAIAQLIEQKRKAYYVALQSGSKGLDVNEWLHFFCDIVLKAQDYTQSMIDFLIEKGKFYERYSSKLNNRQAKAIERMFREGVGGFKGGLSAENYIGITGAARATATRDLQSLVECGALIKSGELKYTRYSLNL